MNKDIHGGEFLIILNIFLIIISILLILLLLILIIPIAYLGNGSISNTIDGEFFVTWGYGLLSFDITFGEKGQITVKVFNKQVFTNSLSNQSKSGKNKEYQESLKVKKNTKKNKKNVSDFITSLSKDLIKEILNLIIKILKILKPKTFYINGVFGFDDAYMTGYIYSIICIIKSSTNLRIINLMPVFDDEILDINVSLSGVITPISIIIPILSTLIKKPVRKLIFKRRKSKRTE